jgi:hypothetical protein
VLSSAVCQVSETRRAPGTRPRRRRSGPRRPAAAPAPRACGTTNRSFITPIARARVVDHDQKIVAKPTAVPSGRAGEQLHALALGVGDQGARRLRRAAPSSVGAAA